MKWFAKRFKYTRELERSNRELDHWLDSVEWTNKFLENLLDEYRDRQVKLNNLTIDEAESLLSACVDYHRALDLLNAADPIQNRVLHIFDKYGVKIIRNKRGDIPMSTFNKYLKVAPEQ